MTIKFVKITLAIFLFLCLAKMPYGFYQFVRFIAMIGFSILAYYAYESNRKVQMILLISLGLLFQPLLKIALGRTLWNIIDVIVGVGVIDFSFFYSIN